MIFPSNKPVNEIIAELARKGAEIKNIGRMCHSCAFKLNSCTNHEEGNVQAAMDCVAYGMKIFHCHTENVEDAGTPCKGFLYAKQYLEKVFGKEE